MKISVFEYNHYRDYLKVRLATHGPSRGMRSRLAEACTTKPAFISQVLSGGIDLSPEHIPPTNELLGHTEDEAHFFTLLALEARAGTPKLERYYRRQLQDILEKRSIFLERVKIKDTVSPTDQALYYSQWFYPAIHALSGVPLFQTRESISERLDLPLALVSRSLEELIGMGLIEKKGGRFIMGKKRIHLEKNSPWVSLFHSHFRTRAIQRLIAPDPGDLHFTTGMSISKTLAEKIRKKMLDVLAQFEPEIADAKEEDLYALNIDLFRF